MKATTRTGTAVARLGAAILGAAGSFALFAAYMVIPPAGFFSGLLAPFPAVFFRLRYGRITALIITLGAAALLAVLFGIQAAALYAVQCAAVALVMPELLLRGGGGARAIVITTAVNLLLAGSAALLLITVTGQNLHLLVSSEINGGIPQVISIYEKAGITGDELAQMKRSMSMAAALIVRVYPAIIAVMFVVMAGCNLALARRSAVRMGIELKIAEFGDFKSPDYVIWLLIAAGFAMLAGNPVITTPALNVLVVLAVLYFLQGLAVISTIIRRQSFAGVLRVVLYMMLLIQPYMAALVAALGIFDLWGDFRTPRKEENL